MIEKEEVIPEKKKQKRGRKPKPKPPRDDNKPPPRRGRRRKCEKGIDESDKNIGFIKNLETIDVAKNKIIMNDKKKKSIENDDDEYETITYPSGFTLRRKKVTNKIRDPPANKVNSNENGCLIDMDLIEEEIEPPKNKTKTNRVLSLNDIIKPSSNTPKNFLNSAPKEQIEEDDEKVQKLKNYKKPKNRVVRVMHKLGDKVSEISPKTDICCWWCTYPFDTDMCFIPTKYDEKRSRYKITGNFCSWNCAKTYFIKDRMGIRNDHNMYMFTRMLKHMKHPINVKMAPPRESLEKFGGPLSIEKFRESFFTNDTYTLQSSKIEYDDSINIRFKLV